MNRDKNEGVGSGVEFGRSPKTTPLRLASVVVLSLVALFAAKPLRAQTTIDFEQFAGSSVFTGIQPPLTVGVATFSGGQVLNAATFLPADPTRVYGTAYFCAGCLPTITIDFSQPVSNLSMLVLNGQTVVVTYLIQDDKGGSQTITLQANFNSGAGTITLPSSGIRKATISGSAANWDFLIDNVRFSTGREFRINVTTFIPSNYVVGPPQARCGFGQQLYFEGDGRGFDPSATSFRTRDLAVVIPDESADPDGLKAGSVMAAVGETRSYAPDALADGVINSLDMDATLHDCHLLQDRGFASTSDMHVDVTRINSTKVSAHVYGGAGNPLVSGAPEINWDFTITIDTSGSSPQWTIDGKHDGFPAYEVYIDNTTVYTYSPGPPPYGISDLLKLFPPLDVSVSRSGTLP